MIDFKLADFVYPKKLPWGKILSDLRRNDLGPLQTSILLGVSHSTFQRWEKGTEPKHSYGVSILTIHSRYCGETLTEERIKESLATPLIKAENA